MSVLIRPPESALRDELQRLVAGELMGPAGGPDEEVDDDRVSERYLVGLLAPQRTPIEPAVQDRLAVAADGDAAEGGDEPVAPPVTSMVPSSCGLTFCVDGSVSELTVAAAWGVYRRLQPVHPVEGGPALVWKRVQRGGRVLLRLTAGRLHVPVVDPEQSAVRVRGWARRLDGDWLVSLFLINNQGEPEQRRDEAWLFQVELSVEGAAGAAPFVRRPLPAVAADRAGEEARLGMAYRDVVELASGHGVGTHAELDSGDPHRARRIRTAAMPVHEVPRTEPPTEEDEPELGRAMLDMGKLAESAPHQLAAGLTPLAEAYERWIDAQARRMGDPSAGLSDHTAAAAAALGLCRRAARRIRAGIELVRTDSSAAEAFRFANRAMWLQRVHGRAAERRRGDRTLDLDAVVADEDVPANRTWRPFQLAFVLLNLPGVSRLDHPERSEKEGLTDLLWFPTGGGKTEAYLGITAYVLALRRLQGSTQGLDGKAGVAVIMRYTLRLLTVQQFQRAATLLCACETIREDALASGDTRWGTEPFRIGLWVGRRTTPNTTEEARRWLEQRRGAAGWQPSGSGSPAQLTSCPWCGARIDPGRNVQVDPDRGRTLIHCGDSQGCRFTARNRPGEGLPVVVVDEEIYRLLPGLLIGTVDKFAQMPWVGQVRNLFGLVTQRCERHGFTWPDDQHPGSHPRRGWLPAARTVPAARLRPPDLIVQDELHLIAGPLGSMVGLCETAIDRLCSVEVGGRRQRPKVIASTATIRRSREQVHAIFLRDVEVFPPAGLDVADSFFARQRPVDDETPGRRYIGICAHGRRFKEVLIRVYVALLGASQRLYEQHGSAADPWMTLVGYFGSIRELAGMVRLVEDDISTRLSRADQHGLARRPSPIREELTSRKSSDEIPALLDQLAVPFGDPDARPRPLDVVVATNMIAVGVDVPRLGAMVVAGQPKATSEYIQATSRVGRAHPGLVLTVYNWARARDLSHYETFEHYHATFYRQVEATSVTPYAARAMDRGLTAVLVSLLRHSRIAWNGNAGAAAVDTHAAEALAAVDAVARRAADVASSDEVGVLARAMLRARLDGWAAEIAHRPRLAYQRRGPEASPLLREPDLGGWGEWTCPTSLRDVEEEINLQLRRGMDMGDRRAPPFERYVAEEANGGHEAL